MSVLVCKIDCTFQEFENMEKIPNFVPQKLFWVGFRLNMKWNYQNVRFIYVYDNFLLFWVMSIDLSFLWEKESWIQTYQVCLLIFFSAWNNKCCFNMILHLEQSKGKHANHDQAVESFLQAHTIAVDK